MKVFNDYDLDLALLEVEIVGKDSYFTKLLGNYIINDIDNMIKSLS